MQTVLKHDLPIERKARKFNLTLGLKRTFNALNDYFGLESVSDLSWFWGFISLASFMAVFTLVVNLGIFN